MNGATISILTIRVDRHHAAHTPGHGPGLRTGDPSEPGLSAHDLRASDASKRFRNLTERPRNALKTPQTGLETASKSLETGAESHAEHRTLRDESHERLDAGYL